VQIGALALRSGLRVKALRYYEDLGILPPPSRTQSGYRDYREDPSVRTTSL
jgi:DNA-binding transcriptional MerR regulator